MRGRYRVGERTERFRCGTGPDGWRYDATDSLGDALEVAVDGAGRVRLVADFDGWPVRGGTLGGEVLWRRGEDEHRAVAEGFTGESPAFDVATARVLRLAVGEQRRLALVELTGPVGAARTVQHAWERLPDPEPDVDRYRVSDLATGEQWLLHLSGEVLVSRDGRCPAVLEELVL